MALEVEEVLAADVPDLLDLEGTELRPPGLELLQPVELRAGVDLHPLVPQPPVTGPPLLPGHAGRIPARISAEEGLGLPALRVALEAGHDLTPDPVDARPVLFGVAVAPSPVAEQQV